MGVVCANERSRLKSIGIVANFGAYLQGLEKK